MKIGKDSIIASKKYGMPATHISSIQKAAELNNTPIAIRAINPVAKQYIEEGCPTKNFTIKTKTADRGIAAGLIPINPMYSRADKGGVKRDDKSYSDTLQECINKDPTLVKKELLVSKQQLAALSDHMGAQLSITSIELSSDYILSWQRNDQTIEAYALWDPQQEGYCILDKQKEPILVLAKHITGNDVRYITTDYDLFVICPHYNSFEPGGSDKAPFRTQGISSAENQQKVNKSYEKGYSGPQEDEQRGNIAPRTKETIKQINQQISLHDPKRSTSELETVHHNMEFHNPFAADLTDSLPCIMVFPKPMNIAYLAQLIGAEDQKKMEQVSEILIETKQELEAIRDFLYTQGYYWPSHAKFTNDIAPFRRESIIAAQIAIQKTRELRSQRQEMHKASELPPHLNSDEDSSSTYSSK